MYMQQNQPQNPMAAEPVPGLLARIGAPIVVSMILQAAYNVVDSAYLARMASGGETALTALSLAFPVQLFMVAVSIGTGVGTNALLARLLGLGDKDRANAAVGNAQLLALVISVVFMLFSAVGVVAGQLVSMAMGLAFHRKLNVELDSSLRHWKPRWDVIRSIYAIGLPAIISQALLTVMTYSLNLILAVMPDVGQNAVTVYGLYYKIQQLIIFAAFGVRDAITPVVAFNYGLRSRARVRQGIRWGLGYTAGLMLLGCAGVELFAQPLAGLFSLSATTHAMCVDCMRIVSLGFLFAGLCIAFQGVFQALECGVESLVISLCRQVLFVLPPVWALTRLVTGPENVALVWWPLALGEAATLVVALVLYGKCARKRMAF